MHDDPWAYNPGDLARHTAEDAQREIAKLKARVTALESEMAMLVEKVGPIVSKEAQEKVLDFIKTWYSIK